MERDQYHHGTTIREYREKSGWSQSKLADYWPRSDGGIGCSWQYVQLVEAGKRCITDPNTLRELCNILHIEPWRFGLSDYDPFHPHILPGHGKTMFTETLDAIESLIKQVWSLRCAARIKDAERGVNDLNRLIIYFRQYLPPPLYLGECFALLDLQVQRLNAVTALERKHYDEAINIYTHICRSAKSIGNLPMFAIALKSLGKELERKGDKVEAVSLLEEARDASLSGSKPLMAFVHSYLIRVYASSGNALLFERAVNTGLTIAHSFNSTFIDATDFIYSWSPISALLAEQSWGYLAIGKPEKTLEMRKEIVQQIQLGQDARLEAWIPLDWARAYAMSGEVEQSVAEAREFFRRVSLMQSPHAISQTYKFLRSLEKAGYSNVKAVQNFQAELQEMKE